MSSVPIEELEGWIEPAWSNVVLPEQTHPCPLASTGDELLDAAQDVCWRALRGTIGLLSPMDVAHSRLALAVVMERQRRGLPVKP